MIIIHQCTVADIFIKKVICVYLILAAYYSYLKQTTAINIAFPFSPSVFRKELKHC